MAKDKEEKKKIKRPTAEKRDIRNLKKSMASRVFKSQIRTSLRAFDQALKDQEKDQIQQKLNGVYSFIDKGVKRGLFKQNKANRIKAAAAAKVAAQAS